MRRLEHDTHHIIPKSLRDEGYEVQHKDNLIVLEKSLHMNIHRLFSNLSPQEQIDMMYQINHQVLSRHVRQRIKEITSLEMDEFYKPQLIK